MKMNLRSYQLTLTPDIFGQSIIEIYTQLDSVSKCQYIQIMNEVLNYLGCEGFFDKIAPSMLAIYTKNGQVVKIEEDSVQ